MRRGDVVVVALPGDLGKPRPAVIIQSDMFPHTNSVALIPITSTLIDAALRYTVRPSAENGLNVLSQVMTDRFTTSQRSKVGQVIGKLNEEDMRALSANLSLLLDLN